MKRVVGWLRMNDPEKPNSDAQQFEELAQEPSPGLLREFWDFLRYNKRWWLTPIIVVLLLVGLLVVLSGSAIAPFIYPFF